MGALISTRARTRTWFATLLIVIREASSPCSYMDGRSHRGRLSLAQYHNVTCSWLSFEYLMAAPLTLANYASNTGESQLTYCFINRAEIGLRLPTDMSPSGSQQDHHRDNTTCDNHRSRDRKNSK